jgi:hypothetical protein
MTSFYLQLISFGVVKGLKNLSAQRGLTLMYARKHTQTLKQRMNLHRRGT